VDLKGEDDGPGTGPSEAWQGRPPWSRRWLRTSTWPRLRPAALSESF